MHRFWFDFMENLTNKTAMIFRPSVFMASLLLASTLLASTFPASAPSPRHTEVVDVVERVSPTVVNIAAQQIVEERRGLGDLFFDFFPGYSRRYATQSLGSGVIIAASGLVVTNAHVIEGASQIIVTTLTNDEYEAELVGADANSDIALLKIKKAPGNLPAATLGTTSDLMIGEPVIAIGNPMGLSHTVTTGVVSALKRTVKGESGSVYSDFIQTDAAINPGNSGGPLANILGEIIGINTAIIRPAEGIGFAIPIDRVKKVTKDLLKYGRLQPIWTGVKVSTLSQERSRQLGIPEKSGAFVEKTYRRSPSAAAGLKPGDVIVVMGGDAIRSREDFTTALSNYSAGQSLSMQVSRDGQKRTLTLTPEEPPKSLGVDLLASSVGIEIRASGRAGLRVTSVARGSQADRIGLEAGDVLMGVNGQRTSTIEEVNRALLEDFDRELVVLTIQHGRMAYNLTFEL